MAEQAAKDTFSTRTTLEVGDRRYTIHSLPALQAHGFDVDHLPYCHRILLENLLRHEDGRAVTAADIEALCRWDPKAAPSTEIAFSPARVLLQDFTGVPAVVDLAAMRDAMAKMGGDPRLINPLQPAELVIDHSVQVDAFGSPDALAFNAAREFERNRERYGLLRWGQNGFDNFRVVPPSTGIVHQVNLEYLARVVFDGKAGEEATAYPDTLVGTDSHTTMVNGLGVLGWGVGGIEAEAAMLGQPVNLLVPQVVGFKLHGTLPAGATATDLVLTATEMLRKKGVVSKFVEFYGPGLESLSLADRATLGNMAPEYGATCAIFPVDEETVSYLRFTGRSPERVALVEAYMKAQGMFHTAASPKAVYSDTLALDLATVVPSIAGPKRPQDRIPLANAKTAWQETLRTILDARPGGAEESQREPAAGGPRHGSVVIAAITSCTNTSNPSVMLGAGLLARNAVAKGLQVKPWVKTSLAPGSKVVTRYLEAAGLLESLGALKFHLVGYGCTTCIGNSGPLPEEVSRVIREQDLAAVSVLSGNRNFEGRISPDVRANYLASPPLVVAYALAGRMDIDFETESLGTDGDGAPVFLRDIWPSADEVRKTVGDAVRSEMFSTEYADAFTGDATWQSLPVPDGSLFGWEDDSTYVRLPTFFEGMAMEPAPLEDIRGARVLALLGDSVTTDHISPAGAIAKDSPAGRYLIEHGVEPRDFNSYGSRRGNHEVMMRGTFANVRLRNRLAPGTEGGWTKHQPSGEQTSIFEAAVRYREEGVPLLVLAGKEYGTGSSRDWAAKGTLLLGVKAVLAESFERIHRSNLIGMGVLPLEFLPGESAESHGLDGTERYDVSGIASGLAPGANVTVRATKADGTAVSFEARTRIDTATELDYYEHGGILQYVLRQLLRQGGAEAPVSETSGAVE
ncbi:MAG: aconitate hydratase AcnA [Planctomycetota bacterium]|jgi:aconitate hydratase